MDSDVEFVRTLFNTHVKRPEVAESLAELSRRAFLPQREGTGGETLRWSEVPAATLRNPRMPEPNLLRWRAGLGRCYEHWGQHLLREGRIAVLMLAGGESTRMGGQLRGKLQVGNTHCRTLFAPQAAKIRALNPEQPPLWLVMTSEAVEAQTVAEFEAHHFFGYPEERIRFFRQDSLPILHSDTLDPYPDPNGGYERSPTGHGGMLAALARAEWLRVLQLEGVRHLYSFIYPNVLERIADPISVGFHDREGHDVTARAIPGEDRESGELMGRIIQTDDGVRLVEYYQVDSLPELVSSTWPASTGSQVWKVEFLERCWRSQVELPYHPIFRPPRLKLEQFNFELFPHAQSVGIVLVRRADEYCPIKAPKDLGPACERVRALYPDWCERGTFQ